jgi:choice-of-anchor A domain-containing protein
MKFFSRVILLLIFAAGEFNLHADINSVLAQWNVVTSGNLNTVNDIGGNSFVGGNLIVPNSFTTASVGNSAIPANEISLAVQGNIDNGGPINVNGGSVAVGGAIEDSRTINMNSHGTITQDDPSALPASPVSQIVLASQYWSTLAANSGESVAANGQLNFNCSAGSSLAVFNVSASQMFGSGYQGFTLMPAAGTSEVLINVSGATANWTSGSFFSQFNTQYWNGHVLFNFYDASTVDLSGQIGGYVVAPNANLIEGNDIDGGVMAANLTVDSEVNLPSNNSSSAWLGDLPNVPIPEGSTLFPGMSALVMFAMIAWQEKRKAPPAMNPGQTIRL